MRAATHASGAGPADCTGHRVAMAHTRIAAVPCARARNRPATVSSVPAATAAHAARQMRASGCANIRGRTRAADSANGAGSFAKGGKSRVDGFEQFFVALGLVDAGYVNTALALPCTDQIRLVA